MTEDAGYHERITSARTEALFVALTIFFALLFIRRANALGLDALSLVLFFLSGTFVFYAVNFRVLDIRLSLSCLRLGFGVFTWTIPLENIEACRLDALPAVQRLGGAGIHFMIVGKRYRASFNFLEYPRLVIAFKKRAGPVRDISFSTRRPDVLLARLQAVVRAHQTAEPGLTADSPSAPARQSGTAAGRGDVSEARGPGQ